METLEERWDYVLKQLGVNKAEFAIRAGIPKGNFSWMTTGKLGLTAKTIKKIKKEFPELNLEWIETGRGAPLLNGTPAKEGVTKQPYSEEYINETAKLIMASLVREPGTDYSVAAMNAFTAAEALDKQRISRLKRGK